MTALGFYERLERDGFGDLGVVIESAEKRDALLGLLDELFATGLRDDWVARLRAADIVSAPINTLLEASNDPDVLANGYVTEVEYPAYGKTLKVHGSPWNFSETPARPGIAPELGAAQRRNPRRPRLHPGADRRFAAAEGHLRRNPVEYCPKPAGCP